MPGRTGRAAARRETVKVALPRDRWDLMRMQGRLKSWNDERGFGFIEPALGGDDLFVHISAFPPGSRRPAVDQLLSFEVAPGGHGKTRAANVEIVGKPATRRPRADRPAPGARSARRRLWTIPAFALLYAVIASRWPVPAAYGHAYLLASLVCFGAYAADKAAAVRGRRRTPESTLLALGLMGGWPGGLLAQELLHHKSHKPSFQLAFWGSVVLNVVVFVGLNALLQAR